MIAGFKSFVLAAALAAAHGRMLSETSIAGYIPQSRVTDHNAIDLDQEMIEALLAQETEESFSKARDVYEMGANSKSYAVITLLDPPNDQTFPAGTEVSGPSVAGPTVTGELYEGYTAGSDTTMAIKYSVSGIQESYVGCRVGASPTPVFDGCLNNTGSVTINSTPLRYTYDSTMKNKNGRTIEGFSINDDKHKINSDPNGDYYVDFQKFVTYYGSPDYADRWIDAAFNGGQTSFTGKGSADFSSYSRSAQAQGVKKGTVFMAIAMYVIRELEDAIDDCNKNCARNACNDDPVNALDEAVAFYTGSLEGTDGSGDGLLMYALADKRCAQFNTCGEDGGSADSKLTSKVNHDIFKEFHLMKDSLNSNDCSGARRNKERIVSLLFIPLIQGTLRYAYKRETESDSTDVDEAEGAVFAASVLPMVHACNEDSAQTIYDNMKTGSSAVNYNNVKKAFESTYSCMKIKCEDVGGYWKVGAEDYYPGAGPCGGSGVNTGLAVGLAIGAAALVIIAVMMLRRGRGSDVEFKGNNSSPDV